MHIKTVTGDFHVTYSKDENVYRFRTKDRNDLERLRKVADLGYIIREDPETETYAMWVQPEDYAWTVKCLAETVTYETFDEGRHEARERVLLENVLENYI